MWFLQKILSILKSLNDRFTRQSLKGSNDRMDLSEFLNPMIINSQIKGFDGTRNDYRLDDLNIELENYIELKDYMEYIDDIDLDNLSIIYDNLFKAKIRIDPKDSPSIFIYLPTYIRYMLQRLSDSISKRIHRAIKKRNKRLSRTITNLFGLSDAHPSNIYNAIFGASSVRIPA